MPATNAENLATLPDWAVISDQRTADILGFSLDTLWRLDRIGDGPPRVRLSPRRHGRPVGMLRAWLAQRQITIQPAQQTGGGAQSPSFAVAE
jgi:hypothetical protein